MGRFAEARSYVEADQHAVLEAPPPRRGLLPWALIAAAIPLLGALLFRGAFVDDAYISFRFAENIADGYAFQWNRGGQRVEGFSNPLWTLISVLVLVGPAHLDTTMFWVAAAVLAAAFAFVAFQAARTGGRLGGIVMLALLVALATADDFWTGMFNGLETPLHGLLLAVVAWRLTTDLRAATTSWTTVVLAGIVTLNRFEGTVLMLVAGLVVGYQLRGEPPLRRFRLLLGVAAIVAVTSLVRLAIFGEVVPLSVAAKSTSWPDLAAQGWQPLAASISRRLLLSGRYFLTFVTTPGYLVTLAGVGVLVWRAGARERRCVLWAVAPVLVVGLAIITQNGGDWMPGHRLLTPYLFLLLGAAAWLVRAGSLEQAGGLDARTTTLAVAGVVVLSLVGGTAQGSLGDGAGLQVQRTFEQWYRERGDYWDRVLADELYIASRAGSLPYAAENLTVYDYHGLVDPCVGRANVEGFNLGKRVWGCTFAHRAAVMDGNSARFARSVARQMPAYDYAAEIALCGSIGQLSRDWFVFFVRADAVAELQRRDPALTTVAVEDWLADPGLIDREGRTC